MKHGDLAKEYAYAREGNLVLRVLAHGKRERSHSLSEERHFPLLAIVGATLAEQRFGKPASIEISVLVREPPDYIPRPKIFRVHFLRQEREYYHSLAIWLAEVAEINSITLRESIPRITPTSPVSPLPRDVVEQESLILQRPPGWEYLLFASVLLVEEQALDAQWRDHVLRYAPRRGETLDARAAVARLETVWQDAIAIVHSASQLLEHENTAMAFGPPGESGDADLIRHLAHRLSGTYAEMLGWAARLRGTSVPSELVRSFELAARVMDMPIDDFRHFVGRCVRETEGIARILSPEKNPIPIELTLTLEINLDPQALPAYTREFGRARRALSL